MNIIFLNNKLCDFSIIELCMNFLYINQYFFYKVQKIAKLSLFILIDFFNIIFIIVFPIFYPIII